LSSGCCRAVLVVYSESLKETLFCIAVAGVSGSRLAVVLIFALLLLIAAGVEQQSSHALALTTANHLTRSSLEMQAIPVWMRLPINRASCADHSYTFLLLRLSLDHYCKCSRRSYWLVNPKRLLQRMRKYGHSHTSPLLHLSLDHYCKCSRRSYWLVNLIPKREKGTSKEGMGWRREELDRRQEDQQ